MPGVECLFLRFLEVLILEDVRRGADQAEADALLAGVAGRKGVAVEHDNFVRVAMAAIMNNFVNAGLADGVTCVEGPFRMVSPAVMGVRAFSSLELQPGVARSRHAN